MPDKDAARKAYRTASMFKLIETFPATERPKLIEEAHASIDMIKTAFPDVSQEVMAAIGDTLGSLIAQIMQVPAYMLSDTLDHTMAAYLVAGAVLNGDFELPERQPEEKSDDLDVEKLIADFRAANKDGEMTVLKLGDDDDFRPGNYL